MATIIYQSPSGRLSAIEFDATMSESHEGSATVTEHPVETGVDIADHVRPMLSKVTLTGCITNTPINDDHTDTTYIESNIRPVGLIAGQPTPFTLEPPASVGGFTTKKLQEYASVRNNVAPYRPPGFPRPAGTPVATPTVYQNVQAPSVGGTSFRALSRQDRVKECFEVLMALCRDGREVRLVTQIRDYESMLITDVSAPIQGTDSIDFSISLTEVRYATVASGVVVVRRTAEKRAKKEESKGAIGPGYVLPGDPPAANSFGRSGVAAVAGE